MGFQMLTELPQGHGQLLLYHKRTGGPLKDTRGLLGFPRGILQVQGPNIITSQAIQLRPYRWGLFNGREGFFFVKKKLRNKHVHTKGPTLPAPEEFGL